MIQDELDAELFNVVSLNHIKAAQTYLNKGANPNRWYHHPSRYAGNQDDILNALTLSVKKGFRELVELLIQHGADVNAYYDQNMPFTPLMVAVMSAQPVIFEILLNNGADASIKTRAGKTAKEIAVYQAGSGRQTYLKMVKILEIREIRKKQAELDALVTPDAGDINTL